MKNKLLKILSALFLAACLVLAWFNFLGRLPQASFKLWFLLLSLLYFLSTALSLVKKPGT